MREQAKLACEWMASPPMRGTLAVTPSTDGRIERRRVEDLDNGLNNRGTADDVQAKLLRDPLVLSETSASAGQKRMYPA